MNTIKDIFVGKKTRNSIYTADAIKNLLVKIACGKTLLQRQARSASTMKFIMQ